MNSTISEWQHFPRKNQVDRLPEGCVLWTLVPMWVFIQSMQHFVRNVMYLSPQFLIWITEPQPPPEWASSASDSSSFCTQWQDGSNITWLLRNGAGHFRHLAQMWLGWAFHSEVFAFFTYGLSMDQAVEVLGMPAPHFIKMDVDGMIIFCEG